MVHFLELVGILIGLHKQAGFFGSCFAKANYICIISQGRRMSLNSAGEGQRTCVTASLAVQVKSWPYHSYKYEFSHRGGAMLF